MEELTIEGLDADVFSLLLGIVVYFLKQLVFDFKRVAKELTKVKNALEVVRVDYQGIYIEQRIDGSRARDG
tara:strand:- start:367 stop:579 length:213 start_codon:yes stop_codon:yes gene_type:complete